MRIISGRFKGRIIKMPKGIRPTQNKVRKALFDILGDIKGLSFLELFAGSGAVGLEALSKGVKRVVFVENELSCINTLKNNFAHLLPVACCLLPLDVFTAIKNLAKDKEIFDIIFLDPPYYKESVLQIRSLTKKTLQILSGYDILTPNGFIITQHFKKDNLPVTVGDLTLFKQSRYGDTVLSFYIKSNQKPEHRSQKKSFL